MTRLPYTLLLVILLLQSTSTSWAQAPDAVQHIANLGSKVAPADTNDIFLVYMPPGSDINEGADQLVRIFRGNDCRASTFLVGSEDTGLIAKVILKALTQLEERELDDCPVIVVGARADKWRIKRAFKGVGAKVYYARYRAPS